MTTLFLQHPLVDIRNLIETSVRFRFIKKPAVAFVRQLPIFGETAKPIGSFRDVRGLRILTMEVGTG
jgi:hypothetical protein